MLGFNISRFGRIIADWSVECMNPDMTLYGMLVYRRKQIQKDTRVSVVKKELLAFRSTLVHPRILVGFVLLDL
jgi:hypothetical protein